MKPSTRIIGIFIFFLGLQACLAQTYTDYKPQYTEWVRNYIVDKIEYTPEHTIFYFRYIEVGKYTSINFAGIHDEYRWCLENVKNPSETYYLTNIKNIRVNNVLQIKNLGSQKEYRRNTNLGEVITCEVYFPRLPKHIKKAHFLEGKTAKDRTNHFHALEVNLKTFDDPELGSQTDETARIERFQKRVLSPLGRYRTYIPRSDKPQEELVSECKARM